MPSHHPSYLYHPCYLVPTLTHPYPNPLAPALTLALTLAPPLTPALALPLTLATPNLDQGARWVALERACRPTSQRMDAGRSKALIGAGTVGAEG